MQNCKGCLNKTMEAMTNLGEEIISLLGESLCNGRPRSDLAQEVAAKHKDMVDVFMV